MTRRRKPASTPSDEINAELGRCRACGGLFSYDVLDAKPELGDDPETAEYTRLECSACYGPGYLPL